MVTVTEVTKGSSAAKAGVLAGDILLSINGHEITDVLDYRFYLTERQITLKLHRGPELVEVTIKKGEYDDIGLEFETFLMDAKHSCRNKCLFCFIYQLPKGLRDT
ncbi:MAG: PDZ domain-containing protein, partial [Clostridia bacterium]|nr:PDZ domain-containing protein [Clostridia bacterium]